MQSIHLEHDISISIAVGMSAQSKRWKNTRFMWSELVAKLSEAVKTPESYKQFMKATKAEQGKIKDVGGFVGGYLSGGLRKMSNVMYRQLVTLDVDFSHDAFWSDFTILYDCAAVIHSTHKSCKEQPRHRLIIPLDREVSQDEYQAIARKIAGDLNIELFDQSTFDANRLMFWPSVSFDSDYYFEYQDAEILCADDILETYEDWHDSTQWPTAQSFDEQIRHAVHQQENPTEKRGLVGIFCRTYTIQEAIAKFLPDIYVEAGNNRYTYVAGSSFAGAIVYDDIFIYSHHGTDPAGGRLCNAYDLVRIHKFGQFDKGKADDQKASSAKMDEFITADDAIKKQIAEERMRNAKLDFDVAVDSEDNSEWMTELAVTKAGDYEFSANNLNLILQNDVNIKGLFRLNVFDNKRYVMRSLPWRKIDEPQPFRDVDYAGIRSYIECAYGIVSNQKVDDALALEFEHNSYHPIRDYLEGLEWDGVHRVDTLLIDYFGVPDTIYARESIRKMLCAAVARVFTPGIKYDSVLVLVGPQGTYKSTFFKKLGKDWFSDTFTTVQGKESFEQLQGAWIVEIAELSGFKKAEVETIKHFISKREDMFRPAYGRVIETYKRQCVFAGTTNRDDFLRDTTGNRRFLPVNIDLDSATKSVMDDMDDDVVDQIWAEAYQLWLDGEELYLTGEAAEQSLQNQRDHLERDDRAGVIDNYLQLLYPDDWDKKDLGERRMWLDDPLSKKGSIPKDIVCIPEIWCECFGNELSRLTRKDSMEIAAMLKQIGWEPIRRTAMFKIYGKQRFFAKSDLI